MTGAGRGTGWTVEEAIAKFAEQGMPVDPARFRIAVRGRLGTMTMYRQATDRYPDGYTDELAERLVRAAEDLHVREIEEPRAYLGIAIAVSDMMRDLDEALRHGAPWPARWCAHPAGPPASSDEDRIRGAMTEARDNPGRVITR